MATRKPIVQNSGDFQQLQSADTLPSSIFGAGSVDGQLVRQVSGAPAWAYEYGVIGAVLHTAGDEIEAMVPYSGTIISVTTVLDVSGSAVVDVWKDTYANYPPTIAKTIVASAPPTVSGALKSQDVLLTGWTIAFSAGDFFKFHLNSVATATRVLVFLRVVRS